MPTTVTGDDVDLSVLTLPEEQELMKALLDYPSLVAGAAAALEPHRVANYLHDTAGQVHLWYHKAHVLNEPEPIMRARLALARASQLGAAERARSVGNHRAGTDVSGRRGRRAAGYCFLVRRAGVIPSPSARNQ